MLTMENTAIPPNFLECKFCESPETLQKLCLLTKCPHQEIRWNYGILRTGIILCRNQSFDLLGESNDWVLYEMQIRFWAEMS